MPGKNFANNSVLRGNPCPRILLLIIVVGISLIATLYNFKDLGFVDGDGMVYYRSAVTDIAIGEWIVRGKDYNLADALRIQNIIPVSNYYAKPLWHIINVISLLIFGQHDYVIPLVNGLFACFSIVLVFLLGELMFDTEIGFWSAILLLPMPIFLWHGRTDMAHMVQLFFLLMGFYFYVKEFVGRGERVFIYLPMAGFCFGLAILTHASSLFYVVCLVPFEMYRLARGDFKVMQFLKRGMLIAVPLVCSAIVINLFYIGFIRLMGEEGRALFPSSGWFAYNTYFDQIKFNNNGMKTFLFSTVLGTTSSDTRLLAIIQSFVYDVYIYEGWLLLLLIAGAWFWFVKSGWREKKSLVLLLCLAVIIPYGILVFGPVNPESRLLLPVFAFSSVPLGFLARELWHRRNPQYLKWGAVAIVLISFHNASPIYSVNSGFKQIAQLLTEKNVKHVYTIDTRVQVSSFMEAYQVVVDTVDDWHQITTLPKESYLILSYRDTFFNPPTKSENVIFCKKAMGAVQPIKKEYFLPELHAMEMSRRKWSPITDMLIEKVLGRNFKRHPFPIALYQVDDLNAFMETRNRE